MSKLRESQGAMRAAAAMISYAAAVLVVGWLTFAVAPPGSNAITALIVSGAIAALMLLAALLTPLLRAKRSLGVFGLNLALIVAVLATLAPLLRLWGSLDATEEFNQAVRVGNVHAIALDEEAAPLGDHVLDPSPKAYQAVSLGSIAVLSGFAALVFLLLRPHVPPKDQRDLLDNE